MKRFLALALCLWALAALPGCARTTTDDPAASPKNSSLRATERPYEAARIGADQELNGINFKLDRVEKYTNPSEAQPPDGFVWLLFWLTVDNKTEEDYTVRDYNNYVAVYADGSRQKLTKQAIVKDADTVFRNIEAGKSIEGYVAAEVPAEFELVRLRYKFDQLGTQHVNFHITQGEIQ